MKTGKGIYDCGHESVTTLRLARSTNTRQPERQSQKVRLRLADGEIKLVAFFLATEFDGFHSSFLESNVS